MSYLKSTSSNLFHSKISKKKKKKKKKFVTKNALFGYFWAVIWKQNCYICNQTPRICLIAKFCERMKMNFRKLLSYLKWPPLNLLYCKISWNNENTSFGTKNALFWYFWTTIFKNSCHNWNQPPRICITAKFCERMEMLKFWTTNALFGYFLARILKNCSHIENHRPRICLIARFRERIKMPQFWTKNVLFGYFWARILKNYCHIWNQHPQICF